MTPLEIVFLTLAATSPLFASFLLVYIGMVAPELKRAREEGAWRKEQGWLMAEAVFRK